MRPPTKKQEYWLGWLFLLFGTPLFSLLAFTSFESGGFNFEFVEFAFFALGLAIGGYFAITKAGIWEHARQNYPSVEKAPLLAPTTRVIVGVFAGIMLLLIVLSMMS